MATNRTQPEGFIAQLKPRLTVVGDPRSTAR